MNKNKHNCPIECQNDPISNKKKKRQEFSSFYWIIFSLLPKIEVNLFLFRRKKTYRKNGKKVNKKNHEKKDNYINLIDYKTGARSFMIEKINKKKTN